MFTRHYYVVRALARARIMHARLGLGAIHYIEAIGAVKPEQCSRLWTVRLFSLFQ